MANMDYQGNSNKKKEQAEMKPAKKIDKVITGEIVVQKRSLGRRFKDTFIEADLRSVFRYVCMDVMVPAARNMIVDGASRGVERLMYGQSADPRRRSYGYGPGPKFSYNNPLNQNRPYNEVGPPRQAPQPQIGPRGRFGRDDYILSTREDAENVVEQLGDIIDTYDAVSVADLNTMIGLPVSHVEQKWGWISIAGVDVRQVREGYLIDLPPAQPI